MTDRYQIQVFSRGTMISEYTLEAANALAAIEVVEADYGDPPEVEYKTIYHEDGRKELALVVSRWHGFMFEARRL